VRVPDYLKPGDHVALIAPARFMELKQLAPFEYWVKQQGWELLTAPNLGKTFHQFGGSPAERLSDMVWALNHPNVKAVFTARGGYGTLPLLKEVQALNFSDNLKWWIGFSDITALHIHLQSVHVASMHGPMAMQFDEEKKCSNNSKANLAAALRGEDISFPVKLMSHLESNPIDRTITCYVADQNPNFCGTLWGGNLSLIYALLAAGYTPPTLPFVLFIEDLDEYLYHIDRMLKSLDLRGVFEKAQAIIVGSMCDLKDHDIPFGKTPLQTLLEICSEYKKPLIWGLPVGHESENMPLKLGFDITFDGSQLKQHSTP
jgi:muramoyltetrapeptide carboxypeptidase